MMVEHKKPCAFPFIEFFHSPCESGFTLNTFPLLMYCVGVCMRRIFASLGLNKVVIGYELSKEVNSKLISIAHKRFNWISYWYCDHNPLAAIAHCQLQAKPPSRALNWTQIVPEITSLIIKMSWEAVNIGWNRCSYHVYVASNASLAFWPLWASWAVCGGIRWWGRNIWRQVVVVHRPAVIHHGRLMLNNGGALLNKRRPVRLWHN